MALDTAVSYTPFNPINFGFSDELTNYPTELPNPSDIVVVTITHEYWGIFDDDGHISTPSVGTAISAYDKRTKTWKVKGQRNDVDSVLNQLKFYPSPDNTFLNWSVSTTVRNGETTQITQSPPAIVKTDFYITVHDANNLLVDEGFKDFNPVQSTYVYYHPYMTTIPPSENVAENTDVNLDFGTLGSANLGNITVTCEAFSSYNNYVWTTDDSSGNTFFDDDLYVGDKKAETPVGNELFRFTGSVLECQNFLDNVTYRKSSGSTVYLRLRLLDNITTNQYVKVIT